MGGGEGDCGGFRMGFGSDWVAMVWVVCDVDM